VAHPLASRAAFDYIGEMLLYIVRHAYAGQHGDPRWPDDSQRPLTRKGRKQFKLAVKRLAKRGFEPDIIATSPFVRCRETADIIADVVPRDPEVVELGELAPGSQLEALISWTNQQVEQSVAWVGHAPDVDRLAGSLLGHEAHVRFAKGAVAAIEFEGNIAAGHGVLTWFVTPKIVGA